MSIFSLKMHSIVSTYCCIKNKILFFKIKVSPNFNKSYNYKLLVSLALNGEGKLSILQILSSFTLSIDPRLKEFTHIQALRLHSERARRGIGRSSRCREWKARARKTRDCAALSKRDRWPSASMSFARSLPHPAGRLFPRRSPFGKCMLGESRERPPFPAARGWEGAAVIRAFGNNRDWPRDRIFSSELQRYEL